ncbi:oxygenase MpaB family protein [Curtobacterium sp. MCBD17_040]|nr:MULTISPECIES: oxygenase MpaB family protein [unclassified Curtobacterium]WIB65230.1 oxygenase MpaB family protein [Curtobacterium sp. MCBD17_040]WIE56262.1 oxygenase MpaB family protein [Curtobacterium sp. MCBD17_003]
MTTVSPAVRRFAADGSLVMAGGRAILLQIADPVVAAGVARHSDFAHRPQQRLVHTLQYVYAVVLGSPADARAAAAFVEHAHRPVQGADDPDHQLWVAATLYESALRMHEVLRGPVDPALAAAVLTAYEPLGGALRVPADRWPSTPAAFDAYWRRASAALRVTDEARGVVRDLLHPRFAPVWIRALMPVARIVTVGMLPPDLRTAYGFAWGGAEQRRYDRTVAVLRRVVAAVPGPVRRLPVRMLLRSLRRAAARRTTVVGR